MSRNDGVLSLEATRRTSCKMLCPIFRHCQSFINNDAVTSASTKVYSITRKVRNHLTSHQTVFLYKNVSFASYTIISICSADGRWLYISLNSTTACIRWSDQRLPNELISFPKATRRLRRFIQSRTVSWRRNYVIWFGRFVDLFTRPMQRRWRQ